MADYSINYNDSRLTSVTDEKNSKVNEIKNTYNDMINNSDIYYTQQKEAINDYANQQSEFQQAETEQSIKEIEQEKEQTTSDYLKEQKETYADYMKANNKYGANAENIASNGLSNSGYSEWYKTNTYNTYQSTYTNAKESYNRTILEYNNNILEAELSNDEALAEISYNALVEGLDISIEALQYKNGLELEKISAVNEIDSDYWNRYQDVISQMNTENELAYQKERDTVSDSQWEKEYDLSLKEYELDKKALSS